MRKPYPSDLTAEQWAVLEPLLPPAKPGGRPRSVDLRAVLNTLFYQARTGCQWDYLPHDLVPKSTARDYLDAWQQDGTWQRLLDALRRQARTERGRDENPRVAYIDSQSVKTTEMGGESRVASATSSSIRWACCGWWPSPAPGRTTARRPPGCWAGWPPRR